MALRGKIALFVVAQSVAAVGAASASATTAKLNITSIGNDQYTLTADIYNTAWGARTRSSCRGELVLVDETAEQVAAVHPKSPGR